MANTPDACTPSPLSTSLWQRFKRFQTTTAVKLDENRLVYGAFGLTAASDARNIISWGFEVSNGAGESASDRMHDWLMSPVGIAVATIESLFLIAFAVLGSYFDENHTNPIIRFLALIWPYLRDSLKAIKNGYKGARSLINIGIVFGAAAAMSNLILPLGVTFGAVYLINRIWYRHMCSVRKKMQSMNELLGKWPFLSTTERLVALKKNKMLKETLEKLCKNLEMTAITDDIPLEKLIALINTQNKTGKIKGYLSAALNGAFDGFYMYAGLYLLCNLVPALAIVVNVFAIVFIALSILRNIYEEHCFQRKLELSAYKAEYKLLQSMPELSIEQKARFKVVVEKLRALTHFTFIQALGESIRDGLGIYCVLTGILFAVSIFTPIPVGVVLGAIAAGVVGLLACAGYNLWKTHQYHIKKKHHEVPENRLPDNTELGRSALSGFKQGGKQSNFFLNGLQEKSENDHYQSSPVIAIATCVLGAILSGIYFLRALAKGFGRDKDELNLPSSSSVEKFERRTPQTEEPPTNVDTTQEVFHQVISIVPPCSDNVLCAPI
jgi:ABC-type multidrug transport system fused ATPase/permease subunit